MQKRAISFVLAALAISFAGGAAAQETEHFLQTADTTVAAIHSDMAFALTAGLRKSASCADVADCSQRPDLIAITRFEAKAKFVAAVLESGVRELFPDIESRIPGATDGLFEILAVDSEEWKTSSSASGKIAISSSISSASSMDNFLAFVIAREMGHVIARHHERNSTASIVASLAMNVIIPGSAVVKSAVSLGSAAIASNTGRDEQARQADLLAMWILKASGFKLDDVAVATAMLQKTPSRERWSTRLANASDYLLTNVQPFAVQPPTPTLARAVVAPVVQVQENLLAKMQATASPVIAYVSDGTVRRLDADKRKVASSASNRTSYYDM